MCGEKQTFWAWHTGVTLWLLEFIAQILIRSTCHAVFSWILRTCFLFNIAWRKKKKKRQNIQDIYPKWAENHPEMFLSACLPVRHTTIDYLASLGHFCLSYSSVKVQGQDIIPAGMDCCRMGRWQVICWQKRQPRLHESQCPATTKFPGKWVSCFLLFLIWLKGLLEKLLFLCSEQLS